VRLRALASEHELLLIVEDTGPGIPANIMDRIFEPFFTTKPLGEGTGLGLSVTLGIVQQLGGRIVADNRPSAEGGGARFTVTLPISGVPIAEPAVAQVQRVVIPPTPRHTPVVEEPKDAKPRVLIIDDESSIRAALRRFFTRRGWTVEEAADGAAGLARIEEAGSEFTVVMSDLKMPGLSGVELHDHLAATTPHILERVIFSTGDVASKDAAEFVRRTHCTVLQKPFELRALETLVNRMREVASGA
jgi:CheY-like chemotaxis protein